MKHANLLVAVVGVLGIAAPGLSHASGDDVATAQVLFDEGKRRMAQHDYAGACPKLAESQHLAPALGTEFNLADCWEHVGKLASSWAAFLDVAEQTHRRGEAEREQAARQRADALEPRLGRLVVEVPVTRRIADLQVLRDGEIVRDALWGISVPIDAGDHHIEARAPEHAPWSAVVHTEDGKTTSVTVGELALAPHPHETQTPPAPVGGTTSTPPPPSSSLLPPPPPPVAPGPSYATSFIFLGTSVVLAGVGVASLVEHEAKVHDYNNDSTCPAISAPVRPAHCNDYVSAANTWNTVAVVSFVGSGIALAGALTAWLTTTPSPKTTTPAAALRCFGGLGSLGCMGTF
jgi:hypothetical protein